MSKTETDGTDSGADTGFPGVLFKRERLIKRYRLARPRILRFLAPPGYGKSTLAKALASGHASSGVCDCFGVTGERQFALRLLAALAQESPSLYAELAGEGTAAFREESPIAVLREVVMNEWRKATDDSFLLIENAEAIVTNKRILRFLDELVATSPRSRTLALSSRVEIPINFTRHVAPHELLTYRAYDLQFSEAEVLSMFSNTDASPELIDEAKRLGHGWPVAMLLFARFAHEGTLHSLVTRLDNVAFDDLHEYLFAEVFSTLSTLQLDALALCTGCTPATIDDLNACFGETLGPDVEAFLETSPFAFRMEDGFSLNPLVHAALQTRYAARVRDLVYRTAENHRSSSRYIRCAQLHLAIGNVEAAASALDSLQLAAWDETTPHAASLLSSFDMETLVRHENLWFAALFHQRYSDDTRTHLALLDELSQSSNVKQSPSLRSRTACLHGILWRHMGALRKSQEFFEAAIEQQQEMTPSRLSRLTRIHYALTLAALGKHRESSIQWQLAEHERVAGDDISYDLERHELSAYQLLCTDRWPEERLALNSYVDAARRTGRRTILAAALRHAMMASWFTGDTAYFEALLKEYAETSENDGIAASEHLLPPLYLAIDRLFTLVTTAADETAARDIATSIDVLLEQIDMPAWQVFFRVAIAYVPGRDRMSELNAAQEYARGMECAELQSGVAAVTTGDKTAYGPLTALMKRIEQAAWFPRRNAVTVDLMHGHVRYNGQQVALPDRVFELLCALAAARATLTKFALIDMLWPGYDETAGGNSLKSSVHRARQLLKYADIITSSQQGYALGDDVLVDVREIERKYRAITASRMLATQAVAALQPLARHMTTPLPALYERWPWFVQTSLRLGDIRHAVMLAYGKALFESGDYCKAIGVAEDMLDLDPCDETAVELGITASVKCGDNDAARRLYRRYRDSLKAELDEDSPERINMLIAAVAD